MSRRNRQVGSEGSSSTWLTTYSDLVTLLLTFFVLLYTFSSIDAAKFKSIATSLQLALTGYISILEGEPPGIDGDVEGYLPNDNLDEQLGNLDEKLNQNGEALDPLEQEIKKIYKRVQEFVEKEGLGADVRLRTDRRGVIIDISDNVLFDTGKADLKPESKELLDKLTELINSFDNNIIVEGHTDNVPIRNSQFSSNWELSVHRATTVVHYFIEEKNISPERLSAAGYGEYRPIAPNDTAEHRALNRRVNILLEVTLKGGAEDGTSDGNK